MAWLLLGQKIEPVQIAGALIVVLTVITLGLRRST
jgi:drug/metabolite transporter (DMT)-like permease